MANLTDESDIGEPSSPHAAKSLATKAADLLQDRAGTLPVWIRAPKTGPDYFTGFSRAKLYELAGKGAIRSVSIREPGAVKGTRLFNLRSILDFVAKCEAGSSVTANA